jgi:hypothetical protein
LLSRTAVGLPASSRTSAQSGRGRCHTCTQFDGSLLRAVRLHKIEDVAEQHDDKDDAGIKRIVQDGRDEAGEQQNQYQGIQEQA